MNTKNVRQIETLKSLRKTADMNQREFAEYFEIPLRTLEDWESGRRKMPDYLLRLMLYYVKDQYKTSEVSDNKTKPVSIISDCDGKRIVVINDLRFKGKKDINWNQVEKYLKEYVGNYYEIAETSEKIYIGKDFPDEFAHSKDTYRLKGPNAKAKANSSIAIEELIQIAGNKSSSPDYNEKHKDKAKYGWYRYDTRFAVPVYGNSSELERYNIYAVRMLVRHAQDGKLYLYDMLRIKKETSNPLEP